VGRPLCLQIIDAEQGNVIELFSVVKLACFTIDLTAHPRFLRFCRETVGKSDNFLNCSENSGQSTATVVSQKAGISRTLALDQ